MEAKMIRVDAFWDAEAQVWVATSDDLAGLVTEAYSHESLVEKLRVIIPELLELNESFYVCYYKGQDEKESE